MGASWSSSWSRVNKPAILWTSIDSPPTTKLYDPFQISVGLSEEACQKLASKGTWHVDFEVDVAHLQKRWELSSSKADESPEQSLTVRGDLFRQIIEEHKLSNDELCNVCALHFKLETGGQTLGEFSLLAGISREGMTECNAAELQRRVYGDTRQNVPDRLQ